jgi:hypothetical protein
MKKESVLVSIGVTFLILTSSVLAEQRHVPSQYSTIQDAIDAANNGDTVIVAEGTYTDNGNRDIDFKGKAITVRSTNPNDPDIVAATIINCGASELEPHRGFYFHSGEDANSIVKGFTITDGYATDSWPDYIGGGAILCEESSPTIANCIITGNSTNVLGSAIYCYDSSPIIINNTITSNSTYGWLDPPIAVFSKYYGHPRILGNTISYNYGYALRNVGVSVYTNASETIKIKDNIFIDNELELGGHSSAIVSDNTFKDFTTGSDGVAIRIGGAGNNANTVSISRNIFCNFTLEDGGGIRIGGTGHVVNAGIIEKNTFENIKSVAIYLGGTGSAKISANIRNNTFKNIDEVAVRLSGTLGAKIYGDIVNNKFINCGLFETWQTRKPAIDIGGTGGVTIYASVIGNLIIGKGMFEFLPAIVIDGMSNSKQYGIFKNNTIVNNSQGIVKGSNVESLEIVNCILWDNAENFYGVAGREISYSDINEEWFCGTNGNICFDPLFVNSNEGDYHLLPDSPCINTGDPNYIPEPNETDLDGNSRIVNGVVDMGAYELQLSDPVELLLDLTDFIDELNLHKGIADSLRSKLDTALRLLEDGTENNDVASVNILQAFINAVEAQRGKKIPQIDAVALIAAAQEILELLSN